MVTKIAVLTIAFVLIARILFAQTGVVINEVMYSPLGSEPQWIELFNSDSLNTDIAGWEISTSSQSATLPLNANTADKFSKYIVITSDSNALRTTRPGNYLIVQCALPKFHAGGDEIVLKNTSLQTVDSFSYQPSWGGTNGKSLERINFLGPTNDSANWGSSTAKSGATPGAENSARVYDLALDSLQYGFSFDTLTISVRVMNMGTLPIGLSRFTITSDTGTGSYPVFATLLDAIGVDSSLTEHIKLPRVSHRSTDYSLYITSAEDTMHSDDTLRFTLPSESNALDVVINEIMFAPIAPEPEWIELLNTTADAIDLSGWTLAVQSHTVSLPDINTDNGSSLLPPDSMVILSSKDTALAMIRGIPVERIVHVSMPTLNNSGSTIALRDSSGNLVDTVSYDGSWIKSSGTSIERIDPSKPGYLASNWSSCTDTSGSTILRPNSVRKREHDLALLGVDGVDEVDSLITFTIANLGRDTSHSVGIHLQVDPLDTITASIPMDLMPDSTAQISLSFPQNFFGLFHGIAYLIDSLDAQHSNDTIRFTLALPVPPDSLVINEIMFAPQPTGTEWMELYNRSTRWISLDSTRLVTGEKRPGEYSHTIKPLLIAPDSFGIIAADSALFYQTYPALTRGNDVAGLGVSTLDFGKDSCFVTLHNLDSTTIDSVHYFKTWQQSLLRKTFVGISLERINPASESNDPRNWQACIDTSGATPLVRNSIASALPNDTIPSAGTAFNASFAPNPFSPDGDGFQDLTTLTIQTGDATSAWAMRVRLYDSRGVMVRLLTDATAIMGATTLSFDGKRDNGQTLPPGLYTVLIELTSQSPLRTLKRAIGVVIAGKLR